MVFGEGSGGWIRARSRPRIIAMRRRWMAWKRVGSPTTLAGIIASSDKIDLMVTGTGAINSKGLRIGKGKGYFDLEWAMLYQIGVLSPAVRVAALVHDCQMLPDSVDVTAEEFDTACDLIATPTKLYHVAETRKPACGILWDRLRPGSLDRIEPLRELQSL